MTCHELKDGKGKVIGFACSRGRAGALCSACGKRPHTKLCDFPLTGTKAGHTCDRKLCNACAVPRGRDVDYCPTHAKVSTP